MMRFIALSWTDIAAWLWVLQQAYKEVMGCKCMFACTNVAWLHLGKAEEVERYLLSWSDAAAFGSIQSLASGGAQLMYPA